MKELIEEIDEILARYEDWMHGIDGDDCTKARKLLDELRKQCALPPVTGSLPKNRKLCCKCEGKKFIPTERYWLGETERCNECEGMGYTIKY